MIELESIHVSRNTWAEDKPVTGTISFTGDLGKIEIKLSEEHIAKILELCATQIVESVRQVAEDFKKEHIGSNLLEHKK
jgi:actin-like ATPase involved in cell morphogenesis